MIASHYAEPLQRTIATPTPLRDAPNQEAAEVSALPAGAAFAMLDNSLGWAWGYAGDDRRVGYVPSEAIAA